MRTRSQLETTFAFRFTGNGGDFFWRLVGAHLLAITIIGIPWAMVMLSRYYLENIVVVQGRPVRTLQARSRPKKQRRSVAFDYSVVAPETDDEN